MPGVAVLGRGVFRLGSVFLHFFLRLCGGRIVHIGGSKAAVGPASFVGKGSRGPTALSQSWAGLSHSSFVFGGAALGTGKVLGVVLGDGAVSTQLPSFGPCGRHLSTLAKGSLTQGSCPSAQQQPSLVGRSAFQ